MWRKQWEETGAANVKDKLITYNMEDCIALQIVTEFLYSISTDQSAGPSLHTLPPAAHQVARVQDLTPPSTRREWCTPEFALPDFAFINKRAHFDYQRDRVFIRTGVATTRRMAHKRPKPRHKSVRVNRSVVITSEACPYCGSTELTQRQDERLVRLAFDLRFMPSGIRRWVTRFTALRYRCRKCTRPFLPHDYRRVDAYGHALKSWAMYEHVAQRSSFAHIAEKLHDYFDLPLSTPNVYMFEVLLAQYYAETYQRLLDKLARGAILHADETSVHVRGEPTVYVWVFTNMEEVVYMYRPSREAGFLRDLFSDFDGVLISDFFGAYDSLPCAQQKCLVHLIRDFNHDIQANPWDEDLKALAAAFGHLLRTIMATVDQYGLRQRHLRKHGRDVERFYRTVTSTPYRSEIAEGYRQRLVQYREKLFTFLNHDGVPWNNNNAEHAVHQFAYYRQVANGRLTETGLKRYLVLLSIYVTCCYKEVSFLQFLLSRETDIDTFCASQHRRQPLPTIELCPEGLIVSRRMWKTE